MTETCRGSAKCHGLGRNARLLRLAKSQMSSNALLMLIFGRKTMVDSLGLWTLPAERLDQWRPEYIATESDRRILPRSRYAKFPSTGVEDEIP